MGFINHRMDGVQQINSPHISGSIINPSLLVMHYTATGPDAVATAKFFQNPAAKVSAHFVVGEDGTIIQCVPLNKKAWHAGKSIWRGKPNCNDYSIGIEICNWGVLTRRADGKVYNWKNGVITPDRAVEARHKNGNMGWWQTYAPEQMAAVERLTMEILKAYPSVKEIVGHEDIAPGRKTDPGPAFPMARFTGLLAGGRQNEVEGGDRDVRKVNVQSLNVRKGPGTNFGLVATLKYGDSVTVIYDGGDWASIRADGINGEAWVYDRYLS